MDSRWKMALKVAAAIIIPGAGIILVVKALIDANEKREFRDYIQKTYGKDDENAFPQ